MAALLESGLLLKSIILLTEGEVALPASVLIVCHRVFVFVLWSKFWASFCFHWFERCVWISLFMVRFSSGNVVSFGLRFLQLLRSVILERMFSGSGRWWVPR